MRHALIAAIRAYQRHLSPRKGYGCAYRLVHGGSGCSGVGLRLVRRYGVWQGVWLLRQRLRRCQQAQRQRLARLHWQSGAVGCEEALCCSAADPACSGLCGLASVGQQTPQNQNPKTHTPRLQRGHCDTSCCECAQICGACDFPLPKRIDEWVAENETLTVFLVLVALVLALIISLHWDGL